MNQNDLDLLFKQKSSVLLDFYANWCAPCKKLSPVLDSLAKELDFEIVKIDIDENRELPVDYAITSIPHLIFVSAGSKIWEHRGFISSIQLKAKLLGSGVSAR